MTAYLHLPFLWIPIPINPPAPPAPPAGAMTQPAGLTASTLCQSSSVVAITGLAIEVGQRQTGSVGAGTAPAAGGAL